MLAAADQRSLAGSYRSAVGNGAPDVPRSAPATRTLPFDRSVAVPASSHEYLAAWQQSGGVELSAGVEVRCAGPAVRARVVDLNAGDRMESAALSTGYQHPAVREERGGLAEARDR